MNRYLLTVGEYSDYQVVDLIESDHVITKEEYRAAAKAQRDERDVGYRRRMADLALECGSEAVEKRWDEEVSKVWRRLFNRYLEEMAHPTLAERLNSESVPFEKLDDPQ